MRSALYFLPEAIKIFEAEDAALPALISERRRIKLHPLFKSRIYLITGQADRDIIYMQDLQGRTLMVGGGSPPELRAVQQACYRDVEHTVLQQQRPRDYFN